jgi:hypothetical protein
LDVAFACIWIRAIPKGEALKPDLLIQDQAKTAHGYNAETCIPTSRAKYAQREPRSARLSATSTSQDAQRAGNRKE